ncbi:MAG: glycosyltransferase family 4 protein [Pseudolabrys sp.]|nr:glycosyltransferase family 4 protein [Pseudolabrys sp.]
MFSRRLDWANLKMTAECLLRLPIAWRDFLRLYWSFRPDVVYLANHHEVVLLLPLLIWVRRKVVCHMHDPPPAIAFQKFSAWFWRKSVRRFVFISQDAQERMAALVPLTAADTVIYNGVDIAPLAAPRRRANNFALRFNWPADAVIFGICGQIAAHKGHDDLIEAFAIAHQRSQNVRLVIGGRGNDEDVARLQRLIAERRLGDVVQFCGWAPQAGDFYNAIDVLVLASRHDEGFGLVVAEGGERGLPAIVTRSGGVVEVVEEGVTALVTRKQAPDELATAILTLAADEARRIDLGRRARERVAARFDLTKQAARFADCLEEVARQPAHAAMPMSAGE